MKKEIAFIAYFFIPIFSFSQWKADVQIGVHRSAFDGLHNYESFGYFKPARLIYNSTDSQLYYGNTFETHEKQIGKNFSFTIRKKIGKKFFTGISIGYKQYKTEQLRYSGKSETYPFKIRSYPPGLDIYETYGYKDNFFTVGSVIQYMPIKKIGFEFIPSLWKRESARYEAGFLIKTGPAAGSGQTVFKSNPDYRNYGVVLQGGIVFYPAEDISFGIEHTRFMSAINKEKQIEKSFYTAWGVKLIYSFNLKKLKWLME